MHFGAQLNENYKEIICLEGVFYFFHGANSVEPYIAERGAK